MPNKLSYAKKVALLQEILWVSNIMAGKIITINHLRIKAWVAHVLEGLHLTVGEEDMETMEIMETMTQIPQVAVKTLPIIVSSNFECF